MALDEGAKERWRGGGRSTYVLYVLYLFSLSAVCYSADLLVSFPYNVPLKEVSPRIFPLENLLGSSHFTSKILQPGLIPEMLTSSWE